ncbi:hypothetical protein psyc5s11_36410 [Clostridium gelidum]|uniref:Uncharacterized protein n=1 Tax=Clostridium gelidum TaxID=704125 RepID=A0ABM7T841_9CLOT|nr:hypothetical protein [Clostridium gelidum]BCZ47574.1 hypothetical protein psyc5s11_36410 [Clostridium gelidum]
MIKKIEELIQNQFFNKWIIRTNSAGISYIMVVILFISMTLIKSKILSEILLILFCIILSLRIGFRLKKLINLDYYKINDEIQKEDRLARSYQLGDFVAIIIYILFAISFFGCSKDMFNGILGIIFFVIIYLGAASFSIYTHKLNVSCKTITVFLATIQGTFIVLMGFGLILVGITNILNLINTSRSDNRPLEDFLKIFDYKKIMLFSYFIKEYSTEIIIITVISTIVSILLYVIFIMSVPAYQLDKLAFAFKIVSTIIVIGGIAIYFYGNAIYPYIQEFANEIKDNPLLMYQKFGEDTSEGLKNFILNYSKTEITNLGYILFLPYTIAILISTLVIEFVKNKNTKKSNLAFYKIFEICENRSKNNTAINDKDIEIFEKRFCYYGGDKHKMKLVRKTYGLKI